MIVDGINIEEKYSEIEKYHKNNALPCILPKLKHGDTYSESALTLVYLSRYYPNTLSMSKDDITRFCEKCIGKKINDLQAPRHLATQYGWCIQSGRNNPSPDVPSGYYKLITLESSLPNFSKKRRENYGNNDFEKIKKSYGYRCATCGSKEGEPHNYWKHTIVKLEKGHMDPTKSLSEGNIIPQCQCCNKAVKGKFKFSKSGLPTGLATTKDGLRETEKFIMKAPKELLSELSEEAIKKVQKLFDTLHDR